MERWELLERDIDVIDDVTHCFESFYMDNYYNPWNGDWLSDDYTKIIEISTAPGRIDEMDLRRLSNAILHLNNDRDIIVQKLRNPELIWAYNSVAEQVNTIREGDERFSPMALMNPLPELHVEQLEAVDDAA